MPPQLACRIKPEFTYDIKAGAFDKRPLVAQAIAECINAWSGVESAMGWLFLSLLRGNDERGARLYAALDSGKAKRSAIDALAASALNDSDYALICALLKYINSQQKIRDKIAHWIWGVSPELEDHMILLDPKDQIHGIGYMTAFLRALAARKTEDFFDRHASQFSRSVVYAYSLKSLQMDRDCFIALQDLIRNAAGLSLTQEYAQEQHNEIYEELAGDARLSEFLMKA